MEKDSRGTELSNVIRIDDERVREHLGPIVRGTVEGTLKAMLEESGSAMQRRSLRADEGAQRSALRQLRLKAADKG